MSKKIDGFKILSGHCSGCWNQGADVHWHWTDKVHKLDTIGRKNHGWTKWREVVCNNTDCPGRALIRLGKIEQVVSNTIEHILKETR